MSTLERLEVCITTRKDLRSFMSLSKSVQLMLLQHVFDSGTFAQHSTEPVTLKPFREILLDPVRFYVGHLSLQMLGFYGQRKPF